MTETAAHFCAPPRLSPPQRVLLAEGWTRRAIAFCSGAVGALALAPVGFWPAMSATLVVAVWLIDGAASSGSAPRRFRPAELIDSAGAGWWLGFGYFVAGLWWLGSALLVEADQFAWALPLAVLGLPAALASFTALGFALARLLWSPGSGRIFALAAGLGLSEWLRGHVLTGFPWNDFGMALAASDFLAQAASLVGLHGLDILAIVILAAPATLVDRSGPARWRTSAIAAALVLLTGLFLFGALRLRADPPAPVAGVKLRLMQPNLPQDAKFRPDQGMQILRAYLDLSDQATGPSSTGVADATHLIWPESAFPFILSREPAALAAIARSLQGKVLITGAARAEENRGPLGKAGRRARIFNAIEVLQGERILDFYDKAHLVPLGEYLPFEEQLAPFGIMHLVPGVWDRGTGPRRLSAPGAPPMSPLICYEAVFPGEAVDPAVARPQWLLNVTNDGWFGKTSGPYQHFAQARLRAIEEGLPLVRVANTGISAIVDGYGRVLRELPVGVEGVLDGYLPQANADRTLFSNHGASAFWVLWIAALFVAASSRLFAR